MFARWWMVVAALVLLGGCAQAVNQKNADLYFDLGLRAEWNQDYPRAREAFQRALVNAKAGDAGDAYVSAVLYNLGRMTGYTCDLAEAERLLKQSLELEAPLSGPVSSNMSKRYFELARLEFDQGKYAQAIPYYENAVDLGKKLGMETSEPITLADTYDELAKAYGEAGNPAQRDTALGAAQALRAAHPGQTASAAFVRYNQRCR